MTREYFILLRTGDNLDNLIPKNIKSIRTESKINRKLNKHLTRN